MVYKIMRNPEYPHCRKKSVSIEHKGYHYSDDLKYRTRFILYHGKNHKRLGNRERNTDGN